MAINNLSVGINWTATLITQNGELVIPTITAFDIRPTPVMRKSIPVNQPVIPIVIPNGYTGSLEIDRTNSALENYWTTYELEYYSGINILGGKIVQTVTEPDGSITQMVADKVVFESVDFGRWTGDDFVKQRLNFYCSTWELQ